MFRVLTLCVLMVLGVDSFRNKIRVVQRAEDLLDSHLVNLEDQVDQDLAYLLLISAIYYPALEVANLDPDDEVNLKELYLQYHDKVLPQIEANPGKLVKELRDVVDKDALALEPLTTVVEEQCVRLSDRLCNKLVNNLLASGEYPDLEKSVSVLDKSYNAARLFLERTTQLERLSKTTRFRSYLLTNPHKEAHILVLADWLREILPVSVPYTV